MLKNKVGKEARVDKRLAVETESTCVSSQAQSETREPPFSATYIFSHFMIMNKVGEETCVHKGSEVNLCQQPNSARNVQASSCFCNATKLREL